LNGLEKFMGELPAGIPMFKPCIVELIIGPKVAAGSEQPTNNAFRLKLL
jgi:hypothetical protein